jgi:hypothetical protein
VPAAGEVALLRGKRRATSSSLQELGWIYREADCLVARDESRRKLGTYYPDAGPLRRALYPKHLEFFAAGAAHRERLFMAANRVGKTEGVGGYETVLHLTGAYPSWWEGRRFDRPVAAWVAGKTNETTRDIVQAKLFGRVEGSGARKRFAGTGLVPGEAIGGCTWRGAFPDLADTVAVKHAGGGWSTLGIKSYQQGRGRSRAPSRMWCGSTRSRRSTSTSSAWCAR